MRVISNRIIANTLVRSIIDGFVLLLNITYGMSFLKVWLLDIFRFPRYIDITIITFICYIIRFGTKIYLLPSNRAILPKLFLFICLLDVLQNLFYNDGLVRAFARFVFLINCFFFMEYFYSIYLERKQTKQSLLKATAVFEYYGLYNIIVVCLSVFLISIGLLSATDNILATNSLTYDNVQNGGTYTFPGYLSIAQLSDEIRVLGAFGIPLMCGLSHEPHVLALFVGPAFFLLLYRFKESTIRLTVIYSLLFLMLLAATTVTSVLVFSTLFLIEVIYNVIIKGRKFYLLWTLFVFVALFFICSLYWDTLFEPLVTLVERKSQMDNDEGSKGYSLAMINYFFNAKSLFGMGNLPLSGFGYELQNDNIGYVTSFLDLIFIVLFFIHSVKNVLSKDYYKHCIGMSCMYFFFHTSKLGVQTFSFFYVSFFVVILFIVSNRKSICSVE